MQLKSLPSLLLAKESKSQEGALQTVHFQNNEQRMEASIVDPQNHRINNGPIFQPSLAQQRFVQKMKLLTVKKIWHPGETFVSHKSITKAKEYKDMESTNQVNYCVQKVLRVTVKVLITSNIVGFEINHLMTMATHNTPI